VPVDVCKLEVLLHDWRRRPGVSNEDKETNNQTPTKSVRSVHVSIDFLKTLRQEIRHGDGSADYRLRPRISIEFDVFDRPSEQASGTFGTSLDSATCPAEERCE
jgi:hypothetical protein